MSKYIDADRLRAEIERLEETHERNLDKPMERGRIGHTHGYVDCCDEILTFIDYLQQEQEQYVIGGQVFGATDIEQLYKGKVYIVSKSVQDKEFEIYPGKKVKMLLIKD